MKDTGAEVSEKGPADLDEAFAFFEGRTNLEKGIPPGNPDRIYRLDRMKLLCTAFDNPQDSCRSIHIAGSKGKGSTAGYIAALLRSTGWKVGVYGSPHLVDYRERFRLEGEIFPEEKALETARKLILRLAEVESALPGEGPATTFELLTLFAFLLFRSCGCGFMVLETGLGGRLDATNVVSSPRAVVITPIEKEHTEILGETLPLIAAEKAGIMKKGVPVWSAVQKPSVGRVLRRYACGSGSTIIFINEELKDISWRDPSGSSPDGADPVSPSGTSGSSLPSFSWCLHWRNRQKEDIQLSMGGRIQAENAALALAVVRSLPDPSNPGTAVTFGDTENNLLQALNSVQLPGRFQFIRSNPPVVIDGAHTSSSVAAVAEAFLSVAGENPILLFGSVLGKNHHAMARKLCGGRRPLFRRVIISTPGSFKPSDPPAVARSFQRRGISVQLIADPREAWRTALEEAGGKRAVLVTGSFFMAGEIAALKSKDSTSTDLAG